MDLYQVFRIIPGTQCVLCNTTNFAKELLKHPLNLQYFRNANRERTVFMCEMALASRLR